MIYNMDCITGIKKHLKDDCIDLIVTDPPFAIEFSAQQTSYNRKTDKVLQGYTDIPKEKYLSFTKKWMEEAFRVLRASGSMFVFSGWNHLKDVLQSLDDTGFTTVNHIIWKYQFGVVCSRRFVTSHYHILFVCKDDNKRYFNNCAFYDGTEKTESGGSKRYEDLEDVWCIKREYWRGKEKTPTKLPSAIIEKCILYASKKGDIVLDPFLGSGQVAKVARALNRVYCGFEIEKAYFDFAQKNI